MRKIDLINALSKFNDNDHILLGEWGDALTYIPKISVVCGKTQPYTALYCVRPPGHSGKCFCQSKKIEFEA